MLTAQRRNEINKKYLANKPKYDGSATHKVCNRCGEDKELDAFYKKHGGKYGRKATCKVCLRVENTSEQGRQKQRERSRRYRQDHLELTRERCLQNYYDNIERYRENQRRWRAENRNKVVEYNQLRRAREQEAQIESIPNNWKELLLKAQNNICGICQKMMNPEEILHRDHIIPLSKGGSHTMDNFQMTHAICNMRKGDKSPEEVT